MHISALPTFPITPPVKHRERKILWFSHQPLGYNRFVRMYCTYLLTYQQVLLLAYLITAVNVVIADRVSPHRI